MSVLIIGDIHLGKGLNIGKSGVGNTLNSRVVDQMKLLDWALEQAIAAHATDIVLTGDICEAVKPDYILLEIFFEFLKACVANGKSVHIVAGNHDLRRTGNRYSSYLDLISVAEIENVYVYKKVSTVRIGDTAFTFMPFRDMRSLGCSENDKALEKVSELLTYQLAMIPQGYTKVLVGHLAIEGSIYIGDEFDNLSNELMCPASMFEGYDYTIMGHVHRPQEMEEYPYVAHIGSLDISDFGETDHTKIIMLFDNDDPDDKITEIPVPSRPLRYIPVNVPAGFDSTTYVLKKIKAVHKSKPLDNAIVKLEIKLLDEDADGSDRSMLETELYNLGAFHIILTESKMLSITPVTNQSVVSNEIEPKAAIDIYAEGEEFLSDKEKTDFIEVANALVIEVSATQK